MTLSPGSQGWGLSRSTLCPGICRSTGAQLDPQRPPSARISEIAPEASVSRHFATLRSSDRAEGALAAKAAAEGQASSGGSVVVDQAKGSVVFSRYYHVFVKGEVDALVLSVPEVRSSPARLYTLSAPPLRSTAGVVKGRPALSHPWRLSGAAWHRR